MCGEKCKCQDCANLPGSQKLIDKRRKMKDKKGADFAMRVADEAWKNRTVGSAMKPAPPQSTPVQGPPSGHRGHPMPSPAGRLPPPPPHRGHMMQPSPHGHGHGHGPPPPHYPHRHPHYMVPGSGPPMPMGHHAWTPSPMGVRMPPPGYHAHHGPPPRSGDGGMRHPPPHSMYPPRPHPPPHGRPISASKPPPPPSSYRPASQTTPAPSSNPPKSEPTPTVRPKVPPVVTTPRTQGGTRRKFDPSTSRKKRKVADGQEPTVPYFGVDHPEQTKTAVLSIFSFLSNDDLYHAGLVCKSWSRLAMDDELWTFDSPNSS